MPGTLAQILATKADLVDGKIPPIQLPESVAENGLSAYEIALNDGFVGTEQEWLASLRGADGSQGIQGIQGVTGEKGDRGDSGIQGLPGNDGNDGANGYTPVKGVDYFDGLQGLPGEQGTQGIPGIQGETGLKGDKGDKGDQGNQGIQGIQGIPGEQGLPGSDADVTLHESTYPHVNYNTAYTHSQSTHAPANAQKNSDITKPEIEAKLTGEISTHTHAGGSGADPWTIVKLGVDYIKSTTTNDAVPNFFFTPVINKTYLVFGYFLLRTATATVGARPGISWPTGLTDATMRMEASTSLTASVIRTWGAQTTQNATSTGLATTNNSHWGSLDGIMITSGTTSGNLQVTLASETAGTNVTMKAGSILMYREL